MRILVIIVLLLFFSCKEEKNNKIQIFNFNPYADTSGFLLSSNRNYNFEKSMIRCFIIYGDFLIDSNSIDNLLFKYLDTNHVIKNEIKNSDECVIMFYKSGDDFDKNYNEKKTTTKLDNRNMVGQLRWEAGRLIFLAYYKDGQVPWSSYFNPPIDKLQLFKDSIKER